jgi:hypothetical protein
MEWGSAFVQFFGQRCPKRIGAHRHSFFYFWRYLALFGVSADRIGSGFRRAAKGSSDALLVLGPGFHFSFHADTLSPGRNAVKLYLHYFV